MLNPYLLTVLLTAVAPPFEAQTLAGRTVVGPIDALDADRVVIDTADGPAAIAIDELIRLTPQQVSEPATGRSAVRIELRDGSSVAAEGYTVHGDRATFALPGSQSVELPVRSVGSVRLQPHSDAVADQWTHILGMTRDTDLLVITKGDVLDYHRGALHDVTDKIVRFELDGDILPVKRSKVYGLIYRRAADSAPGEPVCGLTDASGSRWSIRSLSMPAQGKLRWTTPGGATVSGLLAQIVEIDFSRGKLVYLSDLKPQSVVFTPYFGKTTDVPIVGRFFAPRNDTNLKSAPLRLGGKQYAKGVAMHSRTKVVYRLPGRFSRFKATAGIDDGVRPHGNVRLVISGDDKVLLEATLAGSDPPRPIDLDISGVRRVTVLVDFAADSDVADHLDLCNARVVK